MRKIVKKIGNSGHIILSKKLIGKEILVFTEEELIVELSKLLVKSLK